MQARSSPHIQVAVNINTSQTFVPRQGQIASIGKRGEFMLQAEEYVGDIGFGNMERQVCLM